MEGIGRCTFCDGQASAKSKEIVVMIFLPGSFKNAVIRYAVMIAIFAVTLISCRKDPAIPQFQTQNVFIIVMDGARYSETWGDPTHQYVPHLYHDFGPGGIASTQFYNNGPTYTSAGHVAITTGHYQEINNAGSEIPQNPSIFQYWLKATGKDSTAAWIIASKDKLAVLSDCLDETWSGRYNPSANCGINGAGVGSGYRDDSTTFEKTKEIISLHHPNLVLINFREPDYSGHQNNWPAYLQGITDVDNYCYELWNFVQADPLYAGTTTFFVTNDHGRHLDTVSTGFIGHGDSCAGCRHINLFATGPDFKTNYVMDANYGLIDIPPTVAALFGFRFSAGQGVVMEELFK
jgi:hypothetical protein